MNFKYIILPHLKLMKNKTKINNTLVCYYHNSKKKDEMIGVGLCNKLKTKQLLLIKLSVEQRFFEAVFKKNETMR